MFHCPVCLSACLCVQACLEHIFWTPQPFVTKLSMAMHDHEWASVMHLKKEEKKKRLVSQCHVLCKKRLFYIGCHYKWIGLGVSVCLCMCNNITKQWRGWLRAESAAWACPACRWARRSCSPGPTPMGRDPKPWPQNTRHASPSALPFWWRCCGESTSLCEWCVLIICFLPVCLVAENFNVRRMSQSSWGLCLLSQGAV